MRSPNTCNVCGSPDRACGGQGHAANVSVVDVPERATRERPADCFAEATINGHQTTIRTTRAEAAANGWRVLGQPEPDETPPPPAKPKPAPKTKPRTPSRTKEKA